MTDTQAGNSPFEVSEEMETQSVREMIYTDRSLQGPSMPSSAFLDRNALVARSGPIHAFPTADHDDRGSFGLLPNPLEQASSRRLVSEGLRILWCW